MTGLIVENNNLNNQVTYWMRFSAMLVSESKQKIYKKLKSKSFSTLTTKLK